MGDKFTIIKICEHEWDSMIKHDPEVQNFIDHVRIVASLNPRDALYGGRTNAINLNYKAKHDETIEYYDFTSLYPDREKYCKFPIGHPTILTENIDINKQYFGLLYAKVIPPRGLYLPTLPYRSSGKLLFPLCKTCAESKQENKCEHNDEERAITGVWVSEEVYTAVKKGYKIVEIYEVWNFEETSEYDGVNEQTGLFTSYVNYALKLKQQASGFPSHCKTEENRLKYVEEYYQKEGKLKKKI